MTLAIRGRDGHRELEVRQDGTANASQKLPGKDEPGEVSPTLQAINHMAVAIQENQHAELRESPVHPTLNTGGGKPGQGYPAVREGMAVRRLTPRECEALQGFPRGYTLIPWRGKSAEDCPDGPRYKALGNSMAVPVMRWIGERLKMMEEAKNERSGATVWRD